MSNENPEAVTGIKEDDDAENIHRTSPDRVKYNRKIIDRWSRSLMNRGRGKSA